LSVDLKFIQQVAPIQCPVFKFHHLCNAHAYCDAMVIDSLAQRE